MRTLISRFLKREDGQAMVVMVLALAVLLGFAALVIDVGIGQVTKVDLQNAADAAALAAAQDLPDGEATKITAENYAELNGVAKENVTVVTPYRGDDRMIEVVVTRNVDNLFAGTLVSEDTDVAARAVATYGIVASVPWIVPFVIPRPPEFNYENKYVMRMYGTGAYPAGYTLPQDFVDEYSEYVSVSYVTTKSNVPIYNSTNWFNSVIHRISRTGSNVVINSEKRVSGTLWYNITYSSYTGWVRASDLRQNVDENYPYQFDYMNVKIDTAQNFNDYLRYLESGYHKIYSVNER